MPSKLMLLPLVLVAALAFAPAPAHAGKAAGAADPMPLPEANAILADAAARLKDRKATYDDIDAAFTELAGAHAKVGPGRDAAKFRRAAESLLLKGFMLTKKNRREGTNERARVNVRAARLLAGAAKVLDAKEGKALSLKLRKELTTIRKKWDDDWWSAEHLEAGFTALAALNHHGTLTWMADEHVHTKEREIAFTIGALRAMPRFKDVRGSQRREICDVLRKTYVGTELVADRMSNAAADAATKRVWDRLREHVIPAMQHFAGRPTNENGVALSSMREFRVWWNDHKAKNDPAWEKTL